MQVLLNSQGYSYDVHSLIKAFYPDEDVKITLNENINEWRDINLNDFMYKISVSSGDVEVGTLVSGDIKCSFCAKEVIIKESKYHNLDRSEVKNQLKLTLYELLSEATQKSLPWGTLTGIRPTKIPMKMIRDGASDEQIYEYMHVAYKCTDEKIRLSLAIAHRELDIIKNADDGNGYSLYIGIPFCPTTCLYCSFTSYPIVSWQKRTDEYIEALKKEIDYISCDFKNKRLDSIYIGGGTPTTLLASQLDGLIKYIKSKLKCENIRELTVEAGRPDSITKEKLVTLFENGVTRLSINPQTMNDKTLKVIGRRHTVEDIYTAFAMAREVGFDNINMDLILGLPGEEDSDVAYTFDKIRELMPDSVTVHSMAIKRAAGMHKFLEEHEEYKSINSDEMMKNAHACAGDLCMNPYYLYRQKNMTGNLENVGFSKEGKEGIYNILIMEEVQTIIACGAGTVTKRVYGDGRIERCDNVKDVGLYIEKIDEMIERKRQLFAD